MIKKSEIIELNIFNEKDRGMLTVIESCKDIPFDVKRVYYVTGVPCDQIRGNHAHKRLVQLLFCPNGAVSIELNDGKEKQNVIIDRPDLGLLLSPNTWHSIRFLVENTVLCVLASDYYEENDYIRDYNMFIELVNEGFWDSHEC